MANVELPEVWGVPPPHDAWKVKIDLSLTDRDWLAGYEDYRNIDIHAEYVPADIAQELIAILQRRYGL